MSELYKDDYVMDKDHLELLREVHNEVDKIAPERIETYEARARQYLIQGDIAAAQSTLNEYLEMNPRSRHLLEPLLDIAFQEAEK